MPGRIQRSATPASAKSDPYSTSTSHGPSTNAGTASRMVIAIVTRVSTTAVPAASSAGIDRPAEHDRAERVGDVPQGLGEARR